MKILSFNIHTDKLLAILFLTTFLIRVPIIYLYGDVNLENEWLILFNNARKQAGSKLARDLPLVTLAWPS